jgi:FkbH-like protein
MDPADATDAGPGTSPASQLVSVAIAATFTAEPLASAMDFWTGKLAVRGSVAFAPYNQIFQSLLDPASPLGAAQWASVLLIRLTDWVEADPTAMTADQWSARLKPVVEEFITTVLARPARATPLLVLICPPPEAFTHDPAMAAALDGFETQILGSLRQTPGVYAFGSSAVSGGYPVRQVLDPKADRIGRVPYTIDYFTALATFVARMADSVRRPPFKVIVLDCDNTLWRGVCGEGGPEAVTIDAGFLALQKFMIRQTQAGKVLALCSKNVEQDVFDVFDRHAGMCLRREQLVAYRINWCPKSQNLIELARELNLGLDSFIFIDDNPVECAQVRAECPQVLTLQLPEDSTQIEPFLNHVWAFDQLRVTDQDRSRAESYLQNARREAVRKQSSGLQEFLDKLQLELTIQPVGASTLPRASQLTQRTNQFNLSTIRRTESELLELIRSSRHRVEIVSVKDRFGDYGQVGLMIARQETDALFLDTFLLSCRVLGRGVEHQMIAHLGQRALEGNLEHVEIPLIRSRKNQPILDFLNGLAMQFRSPTADGFRYTVPAEFAARTKATAITAPPAETPENAKPTDADSDIAVRQATLQLYQQIPTELSNAHAIAQLVDAHSRRRRQADPSNREFTAPRTEAEKTMSRIWSEVLNIDRVGIHDNYFELGGTSLLAVRLVLDIEKAFGTQLQIAALLKAPTVEQLVEALQSPVPVDDSAVVTLRADGDGPPLFLLPGIGGHVMSYRRLAELLQAGRAVYGLEMRPEIAANRVERPMRVIAHEFAERILAIRGTGPFLLAGWSFGGALALEIAHELARRGHEVPLIAMFDTYGRGYPRTLPIGERLRLHAQRFVRRSPIEHWRYFAVSAMVRIRLLQHQLLRAVGWRKTEFHAYHSPLLEQMVAVCSKAWAENNPGHWPGRLVLLRSSRLPDRIGVSYDDPYNGLSDLADTVVVYPVDADHLGFFGEPAVVHTAAALSAAIQLVTQPTSPDGSSPRSTQPSW